MSPERLAGRYVLLRELGRGGMATVFEASDERLPRKVAVKVLHSATPTALERLRREAGLLASLKHPNLVEIHDFHEEGPKGPFVVMELVEGRTLRAFAAELAPLATLTSVALCWELAGALAAAHERGIVHRDVKPENVMVSERGQLKLTDFGIAAAFDHERLTTTGAVTGSLAYMAPERLDGASSAAAADVYSVGVVLFELCAGHTPFAGKGAAAMAAAAMTKDAPALASVAPRVPPAVSELVARCLSRVPEQRPEDGAALARELAAVLREHLGSAADATQALLRDPKTENRRLVERELQGLLAQARQLLERGQGAAAAKLLNAALELDPTSAEVRELLRRRGGGRRWPAAAGLAAACLVGGAWLALMPRPVAPVAPKLDSLSAPEADEKPGSPPPAPAPAPAPAPSPTPVPAAPQEPRRPPRAKPAAEVVMKVAARPWAEVIVDGVSKGYTPKVRELVLREGSHDVVLANPRCEPWSRRVELDADGPPVVLDVTLVPKKAHLSVLAPPGAEVFVDGARAGTAPLATTLPVEPGEHAVTAMLPDGRKVSVTVRAQAGDTVRVPVGYEARE